MQRHIPVSSENILPILAQFKECAKNIYGQKLKRVILYGSYAKGLARKDSDIDLMIVLSDMESAFTEIERLNDIKFSIGLQYDIYISTNPVTEDSYSHSTLPIFRNIVNEGIEI